MHSNRPSFFQSLGCIAQGWTYIKLSHELHLELLRIVTPHLEDQEAGMKNFVHASRRVVAHYTVLSLIESKILMGKAIYRRCDYISVL